MQVFENAAADFGALLGGMDEAQWSASTPCADWDVRALVNHAVGELLWMPPLFAGKTIAEVGDEFDGDLIGDDAGATWSAAAAAVMKVGSEPGAQERIVHLSFGDFPGAHYLGQVTSDVIVHTWDLARALGADANLRPESLDFIDAVLVPQIEMWRSGGALGPAVDVGAGASQQDRLIALSGRSPDWKP